MKKSKKHKSRGHDGEGKDRSRKLCRYIKDDDKASLKWYVKKHDIDVTVVRLEGDCTLLHLAAKLGNVECTRYLLKKGVDVSHINADGDLALHLALGYTMRNHDDQLYTNLLLPLISKRPATLDVANARDVTCRQLLKHYKSSRSINLDTSESSSSSELEMGEILDDDESEVDDYGPKVSDYRPRYEDYRPNVDPPSSSWSERLMDEMCTENEEMYGGLEDNEYGHYPGQAASYDNWADDISRQYHRKRSWAPPPKPKRTSSTNSSYGPKRPKISEERRKAFEQNVADELSRKAEEIRLQRSVAYKVRLEKYERACDRLFSDSSSKALNFDDIPWPIAKISIIGRTKHVEKTISSEDVVTFLFEGVTKGSEEYLKLLKVQQRRWHPDRFMQKCGAQLAPSDKDRIVNSVTTISQLLNKLSHDGK